jgi:hypothetical protein
VKTPVATLLSATPALYALALIVVDAVTAMAAVNWVDDGVGSLPSVVYRIVVPEVAELSDTLCVVVYAPGVTLKMGVPTLSA